MVAAIYDPVDPIQRDDFKRCRRGALGHRWDEFNPVGWRRPGGLFAAARYILHVRCDRCGTQKHVGFDVHGGFLCRKYDYPQGFCKAPDEVAPTPEELRLWLVKRDRAAGRKRKAA